MTRLQGEILPPQQVPDPAARRGGGRREPVLEGSVIEGAGDLVPLALPARQFHSRFRPVLPADSGDPATLNARPFGRRNREDMPQDEAGPRGSPRSAITGDFFDRAPRPEPRSGLRENGRRTTAAGWPAIAAAIALAAGGLLGVTQFPANEIDPVRTSAISGAAGTLPFEVSRLSLSRSLHGSQASVTVSARIINPATTPLEMRTLHITLLDSNGRTLQNWRHQTGITHLGGGESLTIRSSAIDVSGSAASVVLRAKN